ncbi:RNA polymerase II transcriptional coactivator [Cryptotermes secundus]|nr:RNA polymerase II transcriptional coactivator [Cryptotermes secundus]XP_023705790.1 RNA polymerase II transcriptional coactivator [Cryptotermes secundus]
MGKDKKKKKEETESTSDSGPDDVTPPPSKKAKPNTSGSKSEEEPSWLLEKNRFVKVREYRGTVYIDIREYYDSDGDLKPGKKGISLTTFQWQKLKKIISEVDDAIKERC